MTTRAPVKALGLLSCSAGILLAGACHEEEAPAPRGTSSARAQHPEKPLDRLAPGELAPGDGEVFGVPVPRGMEVTGRFRDSALVVGDVAPEAVANYVRDYVDARNVEIGAARTIFPSVTIKNGDPDRTYRIEVVRDRRETKLLISDITPPPKVEGLTDAERWRQAGLTPEGKPLDPKSLE